MKRTLVRFMSTALAASMALTFASCSRNDAAPEGTSKTVLDSEKVTVDTQVSESSEDAPDDGKEDEGSSEEVTVKESSKITGIWQTASMVTYGDEMHPEYYVQFSDTAVNYGQLKEENVFVFDHADEITLFEEISDGIYRVQAEDSSGKMYTFQTSDSDNTVMEYYETWNENEFADCYRGGSSLFKCT
ncbi:MAG: hypothetical protein IJL19_04530 [Clostridiales bacterium]|nr:hypothetical protein [Clostridiales bacterium]